MQFIIKEKTIKNFKIYLQHNEKSKNTIDKYIRDIRNFLDWSHGKKTDKAMLLEYKTYLCKKYAPRSVNSVLSSLNSFFTFIGKNDFKIKTLKIQSQVFLAKQKELTKEEYLCLLQAAKHEKNKKIYYILQTIASTGIRISELKYITIDTIKTGQTTINSKSKIREIFLPSALCMILKDYAKTNNITSGPIFITNSGKPLDRSFIWRKLKKLCAEANVDKAKVYPHNFRHLFARTFYEKHKDIVRLSDILGHSSVNTTRIYTVECGSIHKKKIQDLNLVYLPE